VADGGSQNWGDFGLLSRAQGEHPKEKKKKGRVVEPQTRKKRRGESKETTSAQRVKQQRGTGKQKPLGKNLDLRGPRGGGSKVKKGGLKGLRKDETKRLGCNRGGHQSTIGGREWDKKAEKWRALRVGTNAITSYGELSV